MSRVLLITLLVCGMTGLVLAKGRYLSHIHYAESEVVNDKYLSNMTIRVEKIRRNSVQRTLSYNFTVHNCPHNVSIYANIHSFMNNEYKRSVMQMTLPYCQILTNRQVGKLFMDDVQKLGVIPPCPCKEGDYYVKNFVQNPNTLPSNFLDGKQFRFEFRATMKKELIYLGYMYLVNEFVEDEKV